jgi:hypothetical protein
VNILKVMVITGLFASAISAQNVNNLIDQIYQANQRHEQKMDSLANYSFSQRIDFIKRDGDDAIEEQSLREFRVFIGPENQRSRSVLQAKNFEDGEWQDVRDRVAAQEEEPAGKEFSLNEMVGPDYRHLYNFTPIGSDFINGIPVTGIRVACLEEDSERFEGELWVHANEYIVLKSILSPSDMPVGIEDMRMQIELQNIAGHWLPAEINIKAEISFLYIFSGKIESQISFYDYEFGNANEKAAE